MWTSMKISHLRDGIKEKASLSVPAHKIKLWKVAIPTKDMNDEKMKILINKSHESINVKEELGGELLEAEDSISSKIENVPADNHIHIIVEPPSSPATTGKRRHEDSDSDEEAKTLASLLTSTILQPPIMKIPSHKFYDRDQALNSMLKVARSNFKGRKSPDHKDHTFILIPGGIGIGKTRMGWESQCLSSITTSSYDTPEFIEALKDPCYISIDLNNGNKYIRGFDDRANESVRIGARVAVASGLVSENLPDLLNTNLFHFSDVICEILKRRSKKVEAIIIHLDEYQLYINDFQKHKQQSWIDSRDFLKEC
ncbi:hypothetical protein GLOIN_2v1805244 [Rhizophagus clarus]|nr:hypothetical protein GLOIN_2v1805244 [Rhizophagus clarus]